MRRVVIDQQLRLRGEPDAVPLARRFVTERLTSVVDRSRIADAELVVSELVTNAVLHAGPDVLVRVSTQAENVRLEVHDAERDTPVLLDSAPDAMTGRGMSMVEMVTSRWGVRVTDSGKCVWCEISSDTAVDGHVDIDDLATSLDEPTSTTGDLAEGGVVVVHLDDVPTEVLLATSAQMDDVERELTLSARGAAAGSTSALAPDVAKVISAIRQARRERQVIRRQAEAAARRGVDRIRLTVPVAVQAIDSGEAYLAALDQADEYARDARLLTLETTPPLRAFRRWFVQSMMAEARRLTNTEPAASAMTFEHHLLGELESSTRAHRSALNAATLLGHLCALNGKLAKVTSADEVVDLVTSHSCSSFGATFAAVYLLDGQTLCSPGAAGEHRAGIAPWRSVSLDVDLPACEAVRTGTTVIVPSGKELARRYPLLAGVSDVIFVCVPLIIRSRPVGVLTLTFPRSRDPGGPEEYTYLASLADVCAQAVDRVQALAAAHATNERFAFLARASEQLHISLDYRQTLSNVAHFVVPDMADWCAVRVLGEHGIEHVSLTHQDPEMMRYAEELAGGFPYDPNSVTGTANVIRTGRPELYQTVDDDLLRSWTDNEELQSAARQLQLSSVLIVPLTGTRGTFGAITMCYAESGRSYTEEDLALAQEIASRAALAVQQAHIFDEQSWRLKAITRVAEAAQQAILAPVPNRVGPVNLAASYRSATKDALVGGDLYEVVPTRNGARVLVGDVRGKGVAAIRQADVVLGFFRSVALDYDSLSDVAGALQERLLPYLDNEDFVTALFLDVGVDGACHVVLCGHPAPLRIAPSGITEIDSPITSPLGLAAQPQAADFSLDVGSRLLCYTDGLIEPRGPGGRSVDVAELAAPLTNGALAAGLHAVVETLENASKAEATDDLALLVAEYAP